MIKPDAVKSGHTGAILSMIEKAGFRIRGMKMIRMTKQQAEGFYEIHREKPFFGGLLQTLFAAICFQRGHPLDSQFRGLFEHPFKTLELDQRYE